MLVCVECGNSVSSLYREQTHHNKRLTICPHCHQIADKYIEWETQIVLLDLILNKHQAFRHILFNRGKSHRMFREVLKFLTVIFAFDSFDRWYLNANPKALPSSATVVASPVGVFTQWLLPHEHQWLILFTAVCETSVYILTIFLCTRVYLWKYWGNHRYNNMGLISAIVLSCFSKMGVLLWMVWDARFHHRVGIELFTLLSNAVSVSVYINAPPISKARIISLQAGLIVALAFAARTLFAWAVSQWQPAIYFSVF